MRARPRRLLNIALRSIPLIPKRHLNHTATKTHDTLPPRAPKSVAKPKVPSRVPAPPSDSVLRSRAQDFVNAVNRGSLTQIRGTYPPLAQAALLSDPTILSPTFSAWTLVTALNILSQSDSYHDRKARSDTIFLHLNTLWKDVMRMKIRDEKKAVEVIRGLCGHGKYYIAMELLGSNASASLGRWTQVELWEAVVQGCISQRDRTLLSHAWSGMRRQAIWPSTRMYNHVLRFLYGIEDLPRDEIAFYLDDMKAQDVPWEEDTYALVLRDLSKRGEDLELQRLMREFHGTNLPRTGVILNTLAQCMARRGALPAAWGYVRMLHDKGNKVERETLTTISEHMALRKAKQVGGAAVLPHFLPEEGKGSLVEGDGAVADDDVAIMGDDLGAAASPLLEWALRGGVPAEQALDMYRQSAASQDRLSSRLSATAKLITRLCNEADSSNNLLEEALNVYRGLCQLTLSTTAKLRWEARSMARAFYALAPLLLTEKRFAEFKSLCVDMGLFECSFSRHAITEFALLACAHAPTHEEAVDCFSHCVVLSHGAPDYTRIINALIARSPLPSRIPPADIILDLISDAQRAGGKAYDANGSLARLLMRYAREMHYWKKDRGARLATPGLHASVQAHVAATVAFIRFGLSTPPDLRLLNTLLNMYNYLGAFDECVALWEELRGNKRGLAVDGITLTVMLDACSFARAGWMAQAVWEDVRRDGFALTKKHWDGLVECWANIGRAELDKAMDVAMFHMGPEGDAQRGIPAADRDTVEILFAYGKREGEYNRVRRMVEEYLPRVYREVLEEEMDERKRKRHPSVSSRGAVLRDLASAMEEEDEPEEALTLAQVST